MIDLSKDNTAFNRKAALRHCLSVIEELTESLMGVRISTYAIADGDEELADQYYKEACEFLVAKIISDARDVNLSLQAKEVILDVSRFDDQIGYG